MGPSGCGKSTVAVRVAAGWPASFAEGDEFHSSENVAKMRRGLALTPAERRPWVSAMAAGVTGLREDRVVLSCSALTSAVRAQLASELPGSSRFVLLDVPRDELARRLGTRAGHFAGPALLGSQLATLEVTPDVQRVDGSLPPDETAEAILRLARRPGFFGA
jgi:gluconokinase